MSKHNISFNVEVRERVGTGGAREARKQGFVPGVLYGGDIDPVAGGLERGSVLAELHGQERGDGLGALRDLHGRAV